MRDMLYSIPHYELLLYDILNYSHKKTQDFSCALLWLYKRLLSWFVRINPLCGAAAKASLRLCGADTLEMRVYVVASVIGIGGQSFAKLVDPLVALGLIRADQCVH